jgi:hypothetical protein
LASLPRRYCCFGVDGNNCDAWHVSIEADEVELARLAQLVGTNARVELTDELKSELPSGVMAQVQRLDERYTLISDFVLSYITHGRRELTLMLAGEKPFACFHLDPGDTLDHVTWDQPFQEHVTSGRLVRCDLEVKSGRGEHRQVVMFALPGETWRFKAYELVWNAEMTFGTSIYSEPLYGTLYGYTDEQNQEFLRLARLIRAIEQNEREISSKAG